MNDSRTSYCFYGSCKDLENRPDAAVFHHTEYWHGIRVHIYRCRYCGRTHREAAELSTPIASDTEDAPAAPHVHHHYGSGIHGCLYDYGPEVSTSIEEAVDDLAAVFELDDSQRRELTERRFIALGRGYGADYAEITPCNAPECPDYLYYVRQFAG